MTDVLAPAPPTREQMKARYGEARARLVRTAVIWGAIAVAALVFSVYTFLEAQDAAADGSGGGSYWVLWGPVVFGGWRAIQAAIGAARLSDEARRIH